MYRKGVPKENCQEADGKSRPESVSNTALAHDPVCWQKARRGESSYGERSKCEGNFQFRNQYVSRGVRHTIWQIENNPCIDRGEKGLNSM
jgi:hypothetical protein